MTVVAAIGHLCLMSVPTGLRHILRILPCSLKGREVLCIGNSVDGIDEADAGDGVQKPVGSVDFLIQHYHVGNLLLHLFDFRLVEIYELLQVLLLALRLGDLLAVLSGHALLYDELALALEVLQLLHGL